MLGVGATLSHKMPVSIKELLTFASLSVRNSYYELITLRKASTMVKVIFEKCSMRTRSCNLYQLSSDDDFQEKFSQSRMQALHLGFD